MDGATPVQAFRKVIAPLAAPGIFTTAILVFIFCLERLPLRHLADLDHGVADRPGRARVLHRQLAVRTAHRVDRGSRGDHHHPHRHLRAALPASYRRRAHVRRRQGLRGSRPWRTSCSTGSPSVTPTALSPSQSVEPRDRRRRVRHPRRTIRLREVHHAQHDRRPRGHHRRRTADRRRGRQQQGAQGPRHRDGVPELRALPAHDRAREHGLPAEAGQGRQGRHPAEGGGRRRGAGADRSTSTASRPTSPAGSGSGSRWAARSCATPRRS